MSCRKPNCELSECHLATTTPQRRQYRLRHRSLADSLQCNTRPCPSLRRSPHPRRQATMSRDSPSHRSSCRVDGLPQVIAQAWHLPSVLGATQPSTMPGSQSLFPWDIPPSSFQTSRRHWAGLRSTGRIRLQCSMGFFPLCRLLHRRALHRLAAPPLTRINDTNLCNTP